ncbi:MAG: esterase, depolymerase family protein [Sphingomonas bacterium]|nr:esterase, depolymerase family protein [Sphingomonas bacterium]
MMKNPFAAMARAQRLARRGRPLSAALALQKMLSPPAPPKRAKAVAKRATPRPEPILRSTRPPPGSFIRGQFSGPHGDIAYKLYTPIGSARRRMPLLVLLHGCGQSADDIARGTGMNALADELGYLVLYPEQAMSANLGRCWNWHRPGDQKRGGGEPALIAELTRQAAAIGRANRARIYIAGISAGGAAAAIVASAYPELYAALGVHSGLVAGKVSTLTGAMAAMRNGADHAGGPRMRPPPPTIVFHGDEDGVVHPSNAGGFLSHLRRSSTRPLVSRVVRGRSSGGRDFTRTLHARANGVVLLEDWVVHGSGHGWSGGNRAGSHTDPAGPDASREMMRFFLARKNEAAAK